MATVTERKIEAESVQLQMVKDPDAMKDILQRRLPGFAEGQLLIDQLKIKSLRSRHDGEVQISYVAKVTNAKTDQQGRQKFVGQIKPDAKTGYPKIPLSSYTEPEFGPATHLLPELNMILWAWPNEPILEHLPKLLDNQFVSKTFRKHWRSCHLPENLRIESLDTEVVKYIFGVRCTLRHTLQLSNKTPFVVYSKSYGDEFLGQKVFRTMKSLWQSPICHSTFFTIPEPLFYVRDTNTVFDAGLEGKNAHVNFSGDGLPNIGPALGAALAGIHQCDIEGLSVRPIEHILAKVAEVEEGLGNLDSSVQSRFAEIARPLRERSCKLTPIEPKPIHGALRLSQFLIVEDRFAMVDFDGFSMGNPIADVANFVSHILHLRIKQKLNPERSHELIRQFCGSYEQSAPWGCPDDVLTWQTVAHLLCKQAKRSIKKPKKHFDTLAPLLDLAEEILNNGMTLGK